MNRGQLQRMASEWVRMAKNDIRNKVIEFMDEVGTDENELAYALAISNGELNQILEGNGEITLSTFAKLLIATNHVLEIKPIEESPIGSYDNIPNEFIEGAFAPPLPNPFLGQRGIGTRQIHAPFSRPSFTDDRHDEMNPNHECQLHNYDWRNYHHGRHIPIDVPIDEERREQPCNQEPTEQRRWVHGETPRRVTRPTTVDSPFDKMENNELIKVIREHLWDSEINLTTATREELVSFLKEKDKRMKRIKQEKELENDPMVNEFKERLKRTINENPHLCEWTKKFIGELN